MNASQLLCTSLLTLLVPAAAAQVDHAGSDGHVAIAPGLAVGAQVTASPAAVARTKLPVALAAVTASSPQYVARVGTAAIPAQIPPGPPLVFGADPAKGDKAGGEPLTVVGFGLDDGSGSAQVLVGGAAASGVTVATNTVLHATTGPGVNTFGNPLGRVEVAVSNATGVGARGGAFVYAPALDEAAPPYVGTTYPLDVHLPAGSLYQLALGVSVPGVAVPVPPLEGAAELLLGLIQLTPLSTAATDVVTVPLPVPDDPALAGQPIELQAAVLTSLAPLAGTFTNRLVTVVQP